MPVSFASPFPFVAAAAAAQGGQEDPLLMVATLAVRFLHTYEYTSVCVVFFPQPIPISLTDADKTKPTTASPRGGGGCCWC